MRAGAYTIWAVFLIRGLANAGEFDAVAGPLIDRYCVACHNSTAKVAGLDLTAAVKAGVAHNLTLWTKAAAKVESAAMPAGGPRPSDSERAALVAAIREAVKSAEPRTETAQLNVQRLTRVEYTNSLRGLLGIPFDFSRILPDDSEGASGFANDRRSLQMSDALLDRYLNAAEVAVDSALAASGKSRILRFEAEDAYQAFQRTAPETIDGVKGFLFSGSPMAKYQTLEQQMSVETPGVYRVRVHARTQAPKVSGALWFSFDNAGEYRHDAGVLIQGDALRNYETSLFLTAGAHRLFYGFDYYLAPWLPPVPDHPQIKLPADDKDLAERKRRFRGAEVQLEEISATPGFHAPSDLDESKQLLHDLNRYVLDEYYGLFEEARFQREHGYLPLSTGGPDGIYKDLVQPGYVRLSNLTGVSQSALAALWESRCNQRCRENRRIFAEQRRAVKSLNANRSATVGNVFVDWVELEGPLPAESEAPDLHAQTTSQSQRLIEAFARRAFRRPLLNAERDSLRAGYLRDVTGGASKPEALRRALIGILMSPHFLFWIENGAGRAFDGYVMACRLSRFLYSGPPDDALETAAERGDLSTAEGLKSQVRRMLDSVLSNSFSRLFTEQWLDLSAIGRDRVPDSELFREFSWHMAEDMRQEVALDFGNLVRMNGSILDLLDSRHTFLNERLARLYGVRGVEGIGFQNVDLDDANRGGLLGTGAVLTATSLSGRTSPVYRGKFVLEKLLGQKLPPPPANAGTLPVDAGQNSHATLRETMAAHRSNAVCASCHKVIDPIGFGLENFDFVGRWRTRDPGGSIDASGKLPDGTRFRGPAELKQYLLAQRGDDFTRSLTRNLLAYALGREIGPGDETAVQHIVQTVKSDGYRIQTLIREIVLSEPFRYRIADRETTP